jgi:hypothetical protein
MVVLHLVDVKIADAEADAQAVDADGAWALQSFAGCSVQRKADLGEHQAYHYQRKIDNPCCYRQE